ncbi:zinc ribbon domain-containing protein, partial [bacterium]|nr:zinc ribbon domain-containing protein [bacterium]
NNRGKKKRKKLHNYSFTGFMKCGTCDCSITAEKQKGYIYYRCTKKKSTCDEKYIREELLVEQLKEILQKVSLSKEWKNNMLKVLDSKIDELKSEDEIIINKLDIKKIQLENKLDKLLDMKIDNLIDNDEYTKKKNLLISKKIAISEQITDFSSLENNRLERMKKVIIRSSQAKKYLDSNNYSEILSFLKDIGSNFILKGRKIQFEAQIGYSAILNSRPNSDWRRVRDSNPRNP